MTLPSVAIQVNPSIYLKDPQSSDLGLKIIKGGIDLMETIGFEAFTFKKLGQEIVSTEASIYRYFESKHKLLLYLSSWYWAWMEYRLMFALANVDCAQERLKRSIRLISQEVKEDGNFQHVNEVNLHKVVVSESSKAYYNKEVDEDNEAGLYGAYKQLVSCVSDIILEIDPNYKYPHMLVSTVIEGAHNQKYFSEHLPRLTDILEGEDAITEFYLSMVLKALDLKE
ncbi:MAG: helix-turn-helix domain containing protein [Bacteroidetes bacterium]|nr:helix-turn-helix domain containing protein [Bacteroidota bacterium]MDA0972989.1 helix-turn-helix domain containing protein [Bacteroidota bacterium]